MGFLNRIVSDSRGHDAQSQQSQPTANPVVDAPSSVPTSTEFSNPVATHNERMSSAFSNDVAVGKSQTGTTEVGDYDQTPASSFDVLSDADSLLSDITPDLMDPLEAFFLPTPIADIAENPSLHDNISITEDTVFDDTSDAHLSALDIPDVPRPESSITPFLDPFSLLDQSIDTMAEDMNTNPSKVSSQELSDIASDLGFEAVQEVSTAISSNDNEGEFLSDTDLPIHKDPRYLNARISEFFEDVIPNAEAAVKGEEASIKTPTDWNLDALEASLSGVSAPETHQQTETPPVQPARVTADMPGQKVNREPSVTEQNRTFESPRQQAKPEPRVHIGHIDVIIQAPPAPAKVKTTNSERNDTSSRRYLRRL